MSSKEPGHNDMANSEGQSVDPLKLNRRQTLRQIALLRHRQLQLAKQENFIESAEFAHRARELAQNLDPAA